MRLAVRLTGRMGRLEGRMAGEERVDVHQGRVEAGVAVDAAGLTQETPPPPFGMSGGGWGRHAGRLDQPGVKGSDE